MAEGRYHIDNGRVMAEAPRTAAGKASLETLRRRDPRFKRRRIKSILQMYPSRIKVGRVYEMGWPVGQERFA